MDILSMTAKQLGGTGQSVYGHKPNIFGMELFEILYSECSALTLLFDVVNSLLLPSSLQQTSHQLKEFFNKS